MARPRNPQLSGLALMAKGGNRAAAKQLRDIIKNALMARRGNVLAASDDLKIDGATLDRWSLKIPELRGVKEEARIETAALDRAEEEAERDRRTRDR
jgi:hypothetical protein